MGSKKASFSPSKDFIGSSKPSTNTYFKSHEDNNFLKFDVENDEEFTQERNQIEEKRLDLARELENESQRRRDAEDALERLKEEFMKKELEESRSRSDVQARIEQLEGEKQNLQIKIVRISDQFDKGDVCFKDKQSTYEAMLQEGKKAYLQLDETYKGLIEKA